MPRLLIATTISSTINAFLLPFACHFRAQGWKVDALTHQLAYAPVDEHSFDHIWNIDWSRNPLDPRNLLQCPGIIRDIVGHERYDIVHVHTPVASFVTRYALRSLRQTDKPTTVYTAHGFHFQRGAKGLRNAIYLNLERLAGSWTDYLIVINREDEEVAEHYRLVPKERLWYMPGIGIDTACYNPTTISLAEINRVRHELGLAPNAQLFLMIAAFIPRKRHYDALHSLAALRRPDVHLAFAGDGPLIESMRQLATNLGLKNQVHFLGRRADVPALIRTSVATLLTSQQEGLPRSVMESLCMETPVIGTNIRGTRDLLSSGGLLVSIGDIKGLSQAMTWILDSPNRAQALGRQGSLQMKEYALRRIITLHENIYTQALAHIPRPNASMF